MDPMSQTGIPVAFEAQSVDELERALDGHLRARLLDFEAPPEGLASRARKTRAASSDLWFCDYGARLEISFPESDYVRIQIPLQGIGTTQIGRTASLVARDTACISTAAASIRFQPDFSQFVWRVPRSAISRKLSALTGLPTVKPVEFRPDFDLSSGQGRLMRGLMESFAGAACLPASSLLCGEIEQAMISILLGGALHDHQARLEAEPSALAPRQVKLVEHYIEAHWGEPLDYEILAAVSGASVRSLFRAFKDFRGYTPMEFAKRIRLERAMELLVQPDRSESVTAIAAKCGYSSLSAFSRDFAKAYGLSPKAAREI